MPSCSDLWCQQTLPQLQLLYSLMKNVWQEHAMSCKPTRRQCVLSSYMARPLLHQRISCRLIRENVHHRKRVCDSNYAPFIISPCFSTMSNTFVQWCCISWIQWSWCFIVKEPTAADNPLSNALLWISNCWELSCSTWCCCGIFSSLFSSYRLSCVQWCSTSYSGECIATQHSNHILATSTAEKQSPWWALC